MDLHRRSRTSTTTQSGTAARLAEDDLLGGVSRTVLDSVQANIFVADPALKIVYVNPKAAQTMSGLADGVQRAFRVRFEEVLGGPRSPDFRPHDAGKGFAVVAGEVEDLSKQTQAATEEINRMILSVQTFSEDAIRAITEISQVVDQVNQNQESIASAVEEQTATTNEINVSLARAAERAEAIAAFVAQGG